MHASGVWTWAAAAGEASGAYDGRDDCVSARSPPTDSPPIPIQFLGGQSPPCSGPRYAARRGPRLMLSQCPMCFRPPERSGPLIGHGATPGGDSQSRREPISALHNRIVQHGPFAPCPAPSLIGEQMPLAGMDHRGRLPTPLAAQMGPRDPRELEWRALWMAFGSYFGGTDPSPSPYGSSTPRTSGRWPSSSKALASSPAAPLAAAVRFRVDRGTRQLTPTRHNPHTY